MMVVLKKTLKIGDIKLDKGTTGVVRAHEINSVKGDSYLVDFGEHTFVPVEVGMVDLVKSNENKKTIVSEALAKEMFAAGVHFGHKKGNHHPKMDPYIHGIKNDIQIINLEKTMEELEKALNFIEEIIKKGGKISYAFRLVFQSENRTLTDQEVNDIMTKITNKIKENNGWQVR